MKYIILNDINYLFRRRMKLIFIFIFLTFGMFIMRYDRGVNIYDNVVSIIPVNINLEQLLGIEPLYFLYNIFFFVFLSIDLYTKDLQYQVDNIFLRMSINTWYCRKVICISILTFCLKIAQYSIVIGGILLCNSALFDNNIILLFITDILYLCFVESTFILLYIIFILANKKKGLLIAFILFLVIVIPKNIVQLNSILCRVIICIFILLIYIITTLMLKYKRPKIMQSIGEM